MRNSHGHAGTERIKEVQWKTHLDYFFQKESVIKKINKDNSFKKKVMDNVKKKPNILWEIKTYY